MCGADGLVRSKAVMTESKGRVMATRTIHHAGKVWRVIIFGGVKQKPNQTTGEPKRKILAEVAV